MSLRLALLSAALRLTVKPALSLAHSPALGRRAFDLVARAVFRGPPHAVWPAAAGQPPGLWIASGTPVPRGVILYLHGGGYVAGSPTTHARMLARLSRLAGLRVFAPDYPLAPEHPAPAAFDAACAAWRGLLAQGYRAQDIAIGGDSAGGGLALALLARLCGDGTPPRAAFALSPWTDLTFSGASIQANAGLDPMLPASRSAYLRAMVIGDLAPDDPRISPLYARFPGCPPVMIQASDSEILTDDARRMAAHLRAEGAEVLLQTWPRAPHVWQLFGGWAPEARAALSAIAGFLRATRPSP